MIKTCETCGLMFVRNYGRFCSHKCYSVWLSVYNKGKDHPSWRGGGYGKLCSYCGTKFYVGKTRIKTRGKFCSKKCYISWQQTNMQREKSPRWKGDRTSVNSAIRNSDKYATWRNEIFKRDNWVCQECGIKGGKLEAHHIKRFSKILNLVEEKYPLLSLRDMAYNHNEMWNINNGITLCKLCHNKTKTGRRI